MTQPEFWSKPPGLWSRLLSPASWVFRLLGSLNTRASVADEIEVPVICVGNINVGGTGKTPTALAIADRLKQLGMDAHFLTRGYLGRLTGPLRVDLSHHDAGDVGDEPMLLAAHAPTWIAKKRALGALEAARNGADIIIMDDGFQNPNVQKDLSVIVIDGETGFGNGKVMPAGPLREPVRKALERADVVIVIGGPDNLRPDIASALEGFPSPVLRAQLRPPANITALQNDKVFAFAGIGRPEKFFGMLRRHNLDVVGTKGFPDHHDFKPEEMMDLVEAAGAARLVTTAKDYARLDEDARSFCTMIPVRLVFDEPAMLDTILGPVIPDANKAVV